MAGLRQYVITFAVVILFTSFLFSFIYSYVKATNPDSEILSSDYGINESLSRMSRSLSEFSNASMSVYGYTQSQDFKPSAGEYLFLIAKGIFYIPVTLIGFVFNGITGLLAVISGTFGNSAVGNIFATAFAVLFAGMLITLIFLIVKNIRTGESER